MEYAHIGLVDGPGNSLASYHAATLKLCDFIVKGRYVLVHDHDSTSRAVAVVIMAMHALERRGWDYWLGVISKKMDTSPHEEHKRAFNKMNWRLISSVLEAK